MNPSSIASLFPELERELLGFATTGVFPSQKIRELIQKGGVRSDVPIEDLQIQPASMDLRLGAVAYRVQASFLPGQQGTVEKKIQEVKMCTLDLSSPTVLERGCVYIVPLMEEVVLPRDVSGKANPRSSTGRLDIFTRLLADGSNEFDRVPSGYRGPLYAEVVPRTFTVLAREGMRLNQLRFIRGHPPAWDARLNRLDQRDTLVYLDGDQPGEARIDKGLRISMNLQPRNSGVIGYRAKKNAPMIDLEKADYYDPADFWEPIESPGRKGLILNPDEFYILASREKVRIPSDHAAEMVAYDPSVGEFRIHYAGFFDPGFGYGASDVKGTHAVLEVRSHEAPFLVEDGQIVGRLIYERLLEPSDKVYGQAIGSAYQCQGLSLSRHFKR